MQYLISFAKSANTDWLQLSESDLCQDIFDIQCVKLELIKYNDHDRKSWSYTQVVPCTREKHVPGTIINF